MSDQSLERKVPESEEPAGLSSIDHAPRATRYPRPEPRKLVLLSIILLVSGFAIGIPRLIQADANANDRTEAQELPVRAVPVEAVRSYQVTRTYTGQVAAARTSELGFERVGKLVRLFVNQGAQVTAGTAIAQIDSQNLQAQRQELLAQKAQEVAVLGELQNGPRTEDIAVARSRVQDLQSQLELEETRRARRESLYEEGAIAREQLDEIRSSQDALSSRLAAAQSEYSELLTGTRLEQIAAQQAVVQQLEARIADLEITIADSTIKAPFSGTIAERHLDEGTVVDVGQPVVRLVERASPEVEVGVPVEVANQLQLNRQQSVQIGQNSYPATVISILPEVNSATRTRTVVLKLDAAALQSVSPQQVARLAVPQTIATEGFWLPTTALVQGERGLWSAYAVVETETPNPISQSSQYRVERRDVEILHTESDRVLVRGTLTVSDRVIVSGTQRIVPGQAVRLTE